MISAAFTGQGNSPSHDSVIPSDLLKHTETGCQPAIWGCFPIIDRGSLIIEIRAVPSRPPFLSGTEEQTDEKRPGDFPDDPQ